MRFTIATAMLLPLGFVYASPTPYSDGSGSGTTNSCPNNYPSPQCCQSSSTESILALGDLFCQLNVLGLSQDCNADTYCCQDNSAPSSGISLVNLDVSCIKLL